jgi:hypothetical protein
MLIKPNGNQPGSTEFDMSTALEGVPEGKRDETIFQMA